MKARGYSLIVGLAMVSLCSARTFQDDALQKKVSVSYPAMTAKNLMAALQKETGVPFSTAPQTSNDVLLLSVKDVTVQQLMDKIAEADGAEWVKDSQGYRLSRSQGLSNKQDREYLQARVEALKASLNKVLNPSASGAGSKGGQTPPPDGIFTVGDVSGGGMQEFKMPTQRKLNETPVGRALLSILSKMNVNELATIGEGGRVVYATSPTRVQRNLPSAALPALQNFAAEHQKYVEAQRNAQTEVERNKVIFLGAGAQTSNELKGGVNKFLLVVQRSYDSDYLSIQLLVADGEGNIAASASTGITGDIIPKVTPFNPAEGEKPIELTPEAKLHAALMTHAGGPTFGNTMMISTSSGGGMATFTAKAVGVPLNEPAAKPKPTAELFGKILEPEKYDPLSFAVSELVAGLGAEGNLVAVLPDTLLMQLSQRAATPTKPTDLKNLLVSGMDVNIASANGWIKVTPQFLSISRFKRSDRLIGGQLLRSVNRQKTMTLDDSASFAAKRGTALSHSHFEIPYLNVVNQQAGSTMEGMSPFNWGMLKLYGTMDVQMRRNMLNEGQVRASSLSPEQMAIFDRMVYDDMQGPIYRAPNSEQQRQPNRQRGEMTETVMAFASGPGLFGLGAGKLMNERTEFLPNGVPGDTMLNLKVNVRESVLASTADGQQSQYMSADDFAFQNWLASKTDMKGNIDLPRWEKFIPSKSTDLMFNFFFSPQVRMDRYLQDNETVGQALAVPFNQLPASFQSAVKAATERLQQSDGKFGARGGGG